RQRRGARCRARPGGARRRAAVRAAAGGVREARRASPGGTADAREDGDARGGGAADGRPGSGAQGGRRARRSRGRDGEVLRDRGGAGERPRRDAHSRRLRLLARVPAGALLPRRAVAADRGGLERDPAARDRAAPARTSSGLKMDFSFPAELGEIRAAVRSLCERFPGEYWRALEPDRYPDEFVEAL